MAKNLPVTFYSLNGKSFIRAKATEVNQTEATKASADLFGKASTTASQLTATFKPLVGFPYYNDMYRRLHTVLYAWMNTEVSYPQKPLENIIGFMGFRFIKEVGISNRFTAPYAITYAPNGDVTVDIPAFVPKEKIDAPRGCTSLELNLMAVCCKPFEKQVTAFSSDNIVVPYSNAQHTQINRQLPLPAGNDTLTIVAMALKYDNIEWGKFADKQQLRWMPAGVVGCLWK